MSIPIPEGSVVITPTEVYKEMQATHAAVQQVATKVDGFVNTQIDHENRLRAVDGLPDDFRELKRTVNEDHGPRLSRVETRVAMYSAAAAVAGTGIGWAIEYALFHR